jgi:GNAT superfamily N-acetyltransferase
MISSRFPLDEPGARWESGEFKRRNVASQNSKCAPACESVLLRDDLACDKRRENGKPKGGENVLSIKQVADEEHPLLYDMVQTYWDEIMPHALTVQGPTKRAAYFEEEFQRGTSENVQWWAQVDAHQIGFANITLSHDSLGTWGRINDFYITPTWRRQHYGRAFVEALRTWMKGQDTYRIDLSVRRDAPGALAFWRAVGFQLASYRLREYLF